MRPLPIPRSASHVIKNFRTRELDGLMNHLRLYGPFSPGSEAAAAGTAASTSNDISGASEPSILLPNPFIPRKNPKTGRWRDPKYSLRRQAELVKKAQKTGDLSIVPPGPKLFALELRMKRLQASLSPADAAIFAATQQKAPKPVTVESDAHEDPKVEAKETTDAPSKTKTHTKQRPFEKRIAAAEEELRAIEQKLTELNIDLEGRQAQQEVDELAAFENDKNESPAARAQRKVRQAEYEKVYVQVHETRSAVVQAGRKVTQAESKKEMFETELARAKLWENPRWVGDVKKKDTKGEELGIRLYAGRKKMFKGHSWERELVHRKHRQGMLMRDMAARVDRYKLHYKKRRPNPLKPSRLTKQPKLPF